MVLMLVICPESARLEQIEVDRTPFGLVIQHCTALASGSDCPRTCAARLDRSDRKVGTVLHARSCLK